MKPSLLLLALALVACAPSARPIAATPKPEVPKVEAPTREAPKLAETFPTFHVVARGYPGNDARPSRMALCPVENAVFVCGGDRLIRLKDRDLVADDALLAGLPLDPHGRVAGTIDDASGSWPDDAWVRLALPHHDPGYAYYRYQGSQGAGWKHVFTPPAGPHSAMYEVSLVRRGDRPLFAVSDYERPTKYFAPLGGDTPKGSQAQGVVLSKQHGLLHFGLDAMLKPVLRRKLANGKLTPVAVPDVMFFFLTTVGDDVIGYGGDDRSSYLGRFDGAAFQPMDTTGILESVQEYRRFGDTDWVVTARALHRRPANGAFTRWELPAGTRRVWLQADDDVWLARTGDHHEGELLRTFAPTRVAVFERD